MKKNYFLRAAGALLLASVLMLGGVSGTVARFSESAQAENQTVRVAAFRVLFNGQVLSSSSSGNMQVNLFNTLYSSVDGIGPTGNLSAVNQTNQAIASAAPNQAIPIIAPGNGGQFIVEVENLSEVPIKYDISIDPDSLDNAFGVPIEFRVKDGAIWSQWKPVIDGPLSSSGELGMIAGAGGDNKATEILVQWRWVYEKTADPDPDPDPDPNQIDNARNIIDTGLGIIGQSFYSATEGKTLSVGIKATAYQID